jgi:hypothetical protein
MSGKKKSSSELVAAAETLDTELNRFDDDVESFGKLSFNSAKGLERGREMLETLAASEDRANQQVQALVQAVASTSQKQAARVEAVKAKAGELQTRAMEYEQLLAQFQALGASAAEVNGKLKGEQAAVEVDAEIAALVTQAETFVAEARAKHFDDITHLADQLRQQVSAIRGKLQNAPPRPS